MHSEKEIMENFIFITASLICSTIFFLIITIFYVINIQKLNNNEISGEEIITNKNLVENLKFMMIISGSITIFYIIFFFINIYSK
jgi:hypothetical protein